MRTRIGIAIIAAAALGACASIETFRAAPRNLCHDEPVTLTWAASGTVRLEADPPANGTGNKPSSGTQVFHPHESTRFMLTAHGLFSSAAAEADVEVAPPPREFGGLAACTPEGVVLPLHLDSPQVSAGLAVGTVTNMQTRTLVLAKEGVTATLPAGTTSRAFARQRVLGGWDLKAPLAPGESCEAALASVAQRLSVRIAFACGE